MNFCTHEISHKKDELQTAVLNQENVTLLVLNIYFPMCNLPYWATILIQ